MSFQEIPTYWFWIVIVSLILVGISNNTETNTMTDTITNTVLNFDSSLADYTDQFIINKQAGMTQGQYLFGILTILAHIMIFVFLFMVAYYVLAGQQFTSSLFYMAIIVMILHLIYFIFFNQQGLNMDTFSDALPFTGIWHLGKELLTNGIMFKMDGLVDKARTNVVDTVTNVTNDKFNSFDFDMS